MLKGVPQLVHFGPTGDRSIDITDIPAGWKYAADHFLAENVENFVRGKTGIGVSQLRDCTRRAQRTTSFPPLCPTSLPSSAPPGLPSWPSSC